jgi:hypothetical protein
MGYTGHIFVFYAEVGLLGMALSYVVLYLMLRARRLLRVVSVIDILSIVSILGLRSRDRCDERYQRGPCFQHLFKAIPDSAY